MYDEMELFNGLGGLLGSILGMVISEMRQEFLDIQYRPKRKITVS